jgi:hypothetical protein
MNLIQQVEHLLATSSREQMDALYTAANFDLYQKVGSNVLSVEQALALAEATSYASNLVPAPEVAPDRSWEPPTITSKVAAGNNEEMLMAA